MIETKRRITILNVVLTSIILVIGILFWPSSEKFNQSNPRDVNKTQIKVKVKALNIRKEPTIDSHDIGTVYNDEIFTVISRIDNEDYFWYEIKTKQGVHGYLASDRENEYVEVISGLIDREPPQIIYDKEVLVFKEGEQNYDEITCEDNYSKCTLEYDDSNPNMVIVTAKDEDGNVSTREIRTYKVYSLSTLYSDSNDNVYVTVTKKEDRNNYTIGTNYITRKDILNVNKSKSYSPIIDLYDENFNVIDNVYVRVNKESLSGSCINNEMNYLKDEYNDKDILKGSILCINYTFVNKDEKIKYISVGFQGMENYDNKDNALANYNSKYFELE